MRLSYSVLRDGVKALGCAAIILLAGCGDDGPNLGEVSGTVLLDEKPLVKAKVLFQPTDQKSPPSVGITDENGRYVLHFNRRRDGAVVGKHLVKITSGRVKRDSSERDSDVRERVPAKYNAETELTREVLDQKQEIDFKLEGKGKIVPTEG